MKNNYNFSFIFFAIFTILILSISAVSASDDSGFNDLNLSQSLDDAALTNNDYGSDVDDGFSDNGVIGLEDETSSDADSSLNDNAIPRHGVTVIPVIPTGNDASDIQTAINTAGNGDIVDLGSSVYNVGYAQLNITKNITFRGDGENTIIKGYGYVEGYGNSSSTSVLYVNAPGVTVAGIRFENIDPDLSYTDWDTLFGWALKISSRNVLVNNCSFIDYNHGIYSTGQYTTITNSYFNGTVTRLFTSYSTGGKERGTKGIHLDEASNALIANNTFDGPMLDAILLEYGCDKVKILDNKFINNSYSIYLYGDPANENCLIANNTFNNCGHYENYEYNGYEAVFKYLPIINAEETFLSNLAITENTFYLRNYTRVITSASDYVSYVPGGVNITKNVFNKISYDVDASTIFLLDIEAGLMKDLSLVKPIVLTDNEYIEGMYSALFSNYDDYDIWLSYFGDLIVPVGGNAVLLDLDIDDFEVGKSSVARISFKDENHNNLSGNLILSIFGDNEVKTYNITVINGEATKTIENLDKGNYTAIISFGGNSSYFSNFTAKNFTVIGKDSHLNLTVSDIIAGDSAVIDIRLSDENLEALDGEVIVSINNQNYTVSLENGYAQLVVNDTFVAGSYPVSAFYEGNSVYGSSQADSILDVSLRDNHINIACPSQIVSGDVLKLNITLRDLNNDPLTATIYVTANNRTYPVNVISGKAVLDIELVEMGNYTINAIYYGDSSNVNASYSINVEVLGVETILDAFIDAVEQEKYKIGINLTDFRDNNLTASVLIKVDGVDYQTFYINNGMGYFNIENLSPGEHDVSVYYEGDKVYLSSNDSLKFNVSGARYISINHTDNDLLDIQNAINSANPGDIINLGSYNYGGISDLNITKDLTILGDGATIFTAANSKPVFNLANVDNFNICNLTLKVGNGDTIISYIGNDSSNMQLNISDINVEKVNSKVDASTVTFLAINSSNINIENGVILNNVNLDSAMKNMSVIDNGNSSSKPSLTSTKLVASNMKTTAINTAVDGKKGAYFSVTLKDSRNNGLSGKNILITLGSKTYTVKTDSKGVAKLQVNLAKSGTYTITIKYSGDGTYATSSSTAKVTVVKQTPKLTAKSKKFKAKAKTKTVTATLKTSRGKALKGKTLKFKIKGKTYKAKTNSKGVAKVKISLKKKGKYVCTIKNVADSTYKAKTKKIKIRIV